MVDVLCHMCGQIGERAVEHVYPKWLRRVLPIESTGSFNFANGETWNKDVGVRTVNEICKVCNGGWMSAFQAQAQPVLSSLIKATRVPPLSDDHKVIIAKWHVMFAMVFERSHPKQLYGISQAQRSGFCVDQHIPGDWQVWIGATKSKLKGGRGTSHLPRMSIDPNGLAEVGQMTISQIGSLILMSWSGSVDSAGSGTLPAWGLKRVHPACAEPIGKPIRFPSGFHPRILSDVLGGAFPTPSSAFGKPMGHAPFYTPPADFFGKI